jgi:hypothetical protein
VLSLSPENVFKTERKLISGEELGRQFALKAMRSLLALVL